MLQLSQRLHLCWGLNNTLKPSSNFPKPNISIPNALIAFAHTCCSIRYASAGAQRGQVMFYY